MQLEGIVLIALVLPLLIWSIHLLLTSEDRASPAWRGYVYPSTSTSPGWNEANARAERLLREVLGNEPYVTLERQGYLDVPSPSGTERVYRIPRRPGVVGVYEQGRLVKALCLQSIELMPDADVVLMHKLMIEANEKEYLRVANHFPV